MNARYRLMPLGQLQNFVLKGDIEADKEYLVRVFMSVSVYEQRIIGSDVRFRGVFFEDALGIYAKELLNVANKIIKQYLAANPNDPFFKLAHGYSLIYDRSEYSYITYAFENTPKKRQHLDKIKAIFSSLIENDQAFIRGNALFGMFKAIHVVGSFTRTSFSNYALDADEYISSLPWLIKAILVDNDQAMICMPNLAIDNPSSFFARQYHQKIHANKCLFFILLLLGKKLPELEHHAAFRQEEIGELFVRIQLNDSLRSDGIERFAKLLINKDSETFYSMIKMCYEEKIFNDDMYRYCMNKLLSCTKDEKTKAKALQDYAQFVSNQPYQMTTTYLVFQLSTDSAASAVATPFQVQQPQQPQNYYYVPTLYSQPVQTESLMDSFAAMFPPVPTHVIKPNEQVSEIVPIRTALT